MGHFLQAFFKFFKLVTDFLCHLLRVLQLVMCIFFPDNFPGLENGCHQEYTTYYPIQDMLVIVDAAGDQQSTEYKQAVPDKRSQANTDNIGIVVIIPRQQDFFGKQYRAPSKPEWDLNGVDRTHGHTQEKFG